MVPAPPSMDWAAMENDRAHHLHYGLRSLLAFQATDDAFYEYPIVKSLTSLLGELTTSNFLLLSTVEQCFTEIYNQYMTGNDAERSAFKAESKVRDMRLKNDHPFSFKSWFIQWENNLLDYETFSDTCVSDDEKKKWLTESIRRRLFHLKDLRQRLNWSREESSTRID